MIDGYQNEFEFINYLNKKTYGETNLIMQDFLKKLYPEIKKQDIIKAYKYGRYAKVDMVIDVNGIKKGISIKSGDKNSVHLEKIENFVSFLKKIKFNEVDLLLRYLYSDGTNDNTGIIRQSSSEYKINHQDDIILINKGFERIKNHLIKRFLIVADTNYKIKVDAFISGYINDFLWATTEEIFAYLENTIEDSSGIHASNLFIQNWNKNLKYNDKYEYCRNYIQVKWYSMFDDLMKIMNLRDGTLEF